MDIFKPARILLPGKNCDYATWSVLACDQFTSEPAYWEQVESLVGEDPSTLRMIFPEAYIGAGDNTERIQAIHACMKQYVEKELFDEIFGFVYVERHLQNKDIRQGIVGCIDLEHYDFKENAQALIRSSEKTVEDRLPARMIIREGALLESPHILMLIDDTSNSLIEPFAEKKSSLPQLYDFPLMLGGGRVSGWAVTEQTDIQTVFSKIKQMNDVSLFYDKYNIDYKYKTFSMIVGDGNHSLASAKVLWEKAKPALTQEARENHPMRYCLVEIINIRSPAIQFKSIHRLLRNTNFKQVADAFTGFIKQSGGFIEDKPSEDRLPLRIIAQEEEKTLFVEGSSIWPTAAHLTEAFIETFINDNPIVQVDYIHGESSLTQLAEQEGMAGILLPPFHKDTLLTTVAKGKTLPRKTFSMGKAKEKRYYIECRKIE